MKNKFTVQIIFWITIVGILFGFGLHIFPEGVSLVSAIVNALCFSIAVYLNALIFFPRLYNTKYTWLLIIANLISICSISILLRNIEVHFFVSYIDINQIGNKPPEGFRYLKNFFWMVLLVSFSSIYIIQRKLIANEEHNKIIIEDKLNTELKLLKAQINPHFLFNALNNIYSLTYKKSDKAPESVLELSKMLRYVIEDCDNEYVSFKSEIEYIKSFITFQKMKSPNDINLKLDYENLNLNTKVSPLLFIPFIENSFKYSRIEEDDSAFINIRFTSKGKNLIEFSINNSIPTGSKAKSGAGTGINNVKQRLNLIYPEKHNLKITEQDNTYSVSLNIEVK